MNGPTSHGQAGRSPEWTLGLPVGVRVVLDAKSLPEASCLVNIEVGSSTRRSDRPRRGLTGFEILAGHAPLGRSLCDGLESPPITLCHHFDV